MTSEPKPLSSRTILMLVIGMLVLWAVYVSIGVLWNGMNPAGAIVVLVCMGMFLGFWLLLLKTQKRDRQQ